MAFNPLGNMQREIVGEPEYKKIPPDAIHVFRGLPQTEEIVFPEKMENRKCTDIAFVIILSLFVLAMYGFTIAMCIRPQPGGKHDEVKSESRERGYDFDENPHNNEEPHYRHPRAGNGGGPEGSLKDFIDPSVWACTMVAMPLVGFAIMMLVYVGLRWRAKVCFWILTGIDFIILIGLTGFYWYKAATSDSLEAMQYIFNGMLYTCLLIFLIILLICLRKRLPLLFATYEEAVKAIFRVPALLFTPLLTILFLLLSMSFIVYVPLIAYLRQTIDGTLYAFLVLSLFKYMWIQPFIGGSQCMVVAFGVATYYFSRDKSNIRSPYCRSLYSYFRFHTGTVAAGSLILAIITMLKAIVQGATDNAAANRNLCAVCLGVCCICCLACLEEIAEYITRKAYIMTAIHGKSLCKSGKRAMRLLWTNLLDTIAVDKIGSIALSAAFLLIVAVSVLVGFLGTKGHLAFPSMEGSNDEKYEQEMAQFVVNGIFPFLMALFLTMLITAEYMAVLSVSIAIQTIFLCFCEDKEINDGSAERPYYMSQSLLNVIQKAFDDKLAKQQGAANR